MEDGYKPPKEKRFHDDCLSCGSKIVLAEDAKSDLLQQRYTCPNSNCGFHNYLIDPVEYIY